MLLGEKTYVFNDINIKYMLQKNNESDKLVIVFSGFSLGKPVYNYIRTLQNVNVNKLFILDDYGGRGGYYIGNINNLEQEYAVVKLIDEVLEDYNIDRKNVVCVGSSKGGWAALYYAVKYQFGYVIAGEPQITIAKYLKFANSEDVLEYMTIGSEDLHIANEKLDLLLYDEYKKAIGEQRKLPLVFIHAGVNSWHYREQIIPFINVLGKYGNDFLLDIENYEKHDDLTYYFPNLLTKVISEIFHELNNDIYISSLNTIRCENKFIIEINALNADEFALYVYKNGERVHIENYSKKNSFLYEANSEGDYIFVCFA